MTAVDLIEISDSAVNVPQLLSFAGDAKAGAISTFIGTTRDNYTVNGVSKGVISLRYEAYHPMAVKQCQLLVAQARDKWKDQLIRIVIWHRLGDCPVGETSVFIAASSPHRKDAIEAVEWLIDELKRTVPIWKKEVYDDGTCSWKQNSECQGCNKK